MQKEQFHYRSRIAAPADEVFDWHERNGAFERLMPPWEHMEIISRSGGIQNGGRIELLLKMGPFRQRVVAEHFDYQPGRQFRDRQLQGPFAYMDHIHRTEPVSESECDYIDHIEYQLPFGRLGALVAGGYVRKQFNRLFRYRHNIVGPDILAHQRAQAARDSGDAMKILITGATGLVGTTLTPFLTTGGHEVVKLVRARPMGGEIRWDPQANIIDQSALEGFDGVIHLAGDNIAEGRWTAEKKARIRDSRVKATRLLCESLARLQQPPKVLVAASAVGIYGDRGDEILREESEPGRDFLADVCREWEAATAPAVERGIRVVNLRIGVVLSPKGGALSKLLLPFQMGVGGKIGSGKQYMSWITLDDLIGVIYHCLTDERLQGPVNAASPNPVTNLEFTHTLGRVLSRPTIFPVPAFAARLAFGEMADALLLSGARMHPSRLLATEYQFRQPILEDALRHLLGR